MFSKDFGITDSNYIHFECPNCGFQMSYAANQLHEYRIVNCQNGYEICARPFVLEILQITADNENSPKKVWVNCRKIEGESGARMQVRDERKLVPNYG